MGSAPLPNFTVTSRQKQDFSTICLTEGCFIFLRLGEGFIAQDFYSMPKSQWPKKRLYQIF